MFGKSGRLKFKVRVLGNKLRAAVCAVVFRAW